MTPTKRLIAYYERATTDERLAGESWYTEARTVARMLSRRHAVTSNVAAGVIASLSPRVTWRQNIKLADAVLGLTYERGALGANLQKARRIANGERPLDVLRGPKVRAFYRALTGDESSGVIDVWMQRAMRVTRLSVRAYEACVRALQRAAKAVGTTVARLQAIVWTVVRGSAA